MAAQRIYPKSRVLRILIGMFGSDKIRHTFRLRQRTLDELRWTKRLFIASKQGFSWDAALLDAAQRANRELREELTERGISIPKYPTIPKRIYRPLTTEEINLRTKLGPAVDDLPLRYTTATRSRKNCARG